MGLFSFIGGLFGSGDAKKAASKAAEAQIAAMDRAIGEQRRQFDVTQANFEPYRLAGVQALDGFSSLAGLESPGAQAEAIARLKESPFYTSLFDTGEQTILQNASATGGLRGGNTQRGLADFGSALLADTIDRQLGTYGTLANMGMGATGQIAGYGQDASSAISQLLTGQGQARAGAILTRGGINAQNWKNAGSFLDNTATSIFGGGGGFSLGNLF